MSEADICVRALRQGEVVAVPTDTFYGLLADPFSDQALASLLRLKRCAAARPWPLLVPPDFDWMRLGCVPGAAARRLAARFWPGRVTLIVACDGPLAGRVGRADDGAVGLRVPDGPPGLLELLRRWDGPLTGTSANPEGAAPAVDARAAAAYFAGQLGYIMSGSAPGGAPSTVVDTVHDPVCIVRAGHVSEPEILGELQ